MDKVNLIVLSMSFAQAIAIGATLIFNIQRLWLWRFLGAFLISFAGGNLPWIVQLLGAEIISQSLVYLPTGFFFLATPFFYLFTKEAIGQRTPSDLLHLLPGTFELIFLMIIFLLPGRGTEQFYGGWGASFMRWTYTFIWPTYNLAYATLAYRTTQKYRTIIPQVYSNNNNLLRWIRITAIILVIYYLVEFCVACVLAFTNANPVSYSVFVTLLIVYWCSVSGLRQKELYRTTSSGPPLNQSTPDSPEDLRHAPSSHDIEVFEKIKILFSGNHIHRNPDLTLFIVADLAGLSLKETSRVINAISGKNFSQFVNEYRVEDAKSALLDPANAHLNLGGIAEKVGFNSKSTFFTTFKAVSGTTPHEFRKRYLEQKEKKMSSES